jgi:hypothetical protein
MAKRIASRIRHGIGARPLIRKAVMERTALLTLSVAVLAAVGIASCATSRATPPRQTGLVQPGDDTGAWKGRYMAEVIRRLGKPSQGYPLRETGGKILMFDSPIGPHYVLEFGPDQRVVSAVRVK